MLKINEIFHSIQGESSLAGWPTVFVRTSGCHLRCTYCDTTYAYYEGRKTSIEDVLEKIRAYQCRHVCITGGEPLLQSDVYKLMSQLCDEDHVVSLETSGDVDCKNVDPRVRKIIDVKTPDSGEFGKFNLNNLNYAGQNSEYKFVICSDRDFEWAEEFCQAHLLFDLAPVLYSPSFGKVPEKLLAEKIIGQKSRARLQLQLHKYIWNPTERGV